MGWHESYGIKVKTTVETEIRKPNPRGPKQIRKPKSESRNKAKFWNNLLTTNGHQGTRISTGGDEIMIKIMGEEWHFFGTVEGGGCGVTFWGFMGLRGCE